ncbi:hypothetical protein BG844_22090 [Couchioplanes caeruleus subsp. caeruleus]|uniref:Uncharacterized protein n=1 Tax=Couchioplanes caeruleus subsp. caeruleus TaxID=56427 RepID=A0A1K0GSB2_9ACTN|nr:hypothetical protein BG844_22090 [Couchioplanes caeruleus subsp. caeruleus]
MQARCDTTISRRGHGQFASVGVVLFHCARRWRVLAREVRRFGTAMNFLACREPVRTFILLETVFIVK